MLLGQCKQTRRKPQTSCRGVEEGKILVNLQLLLFEKEILNEFGFVLRSIPNCSRTKLMTYSMNTITRVK